MTIKEAILTLNANAVFACERAGFDSATVKMVEDALDTIEDALKAQEPHILTPEEFDENKMVDAEGCIPCWVEYNRIDETWREWWANDYDGWLCLNKDDIVRINGEMDSQRIWSSKPTLEQMEAAPWN